MTNPTAPPVSGWLGGYEAHGVACNRGSAEAVFDRYERCGFLYPAKWKRLAPFIDAVTRTWDASMSADQEDCIHHCLSCTHAGRGAWGSVSFWRSSANRVQSQHLVSTGWPGCSRSVLLAAQDWWNAFGGEFAENWFRQENRYPNRIFGSVPARLGTASSSLERRALFEVDPAQPSLSVRSVRVHMVDDAGGGEARRLLERIAGPVVAAAEELDTGDIALGQLGAAYARVGLDRSRCVRMATIVGHAEPVGLACAYRGPLGLNFSFLENRCDLWIDPALEDAERADVATALVEASLPTYRDCPLPFMLVACDEDTLAVLQGRVRGRYVRTYSRCVWTRPIFRDWYRHVDSFYDRVIGLEGRHRGAGS